MSTYYFLACDTHHAVSGVIGGRSFPSRWWENDENELATFLEKHAECLPLVISEHDDRVDTYAEEAPSSVEEADSDV